MQATARWIALEAPREVAGVALLAVGLGACELAALGVAVLELGDPRGLAMNRGAALAVLVALVFQAAARAGLRALDRRIQIKAAFAQLSRGSSWPGGPAAEATDAAFSRAEALMLAAQGAAASLATAILLAIWVSAGAALAPTWPAAAVGAGAATAFWAFARPPEGAQVEMRRWSMLRGGRVLGGTDATDRQLYAIGADAAAQRRLLGNLQKERHRLLGRDASRGGLRPLLIVAVTGLCSALIVWRADPAPAAQLLVFAFAGGRIGGLGAALQRNLHALALPEAPPPPSARATPSDHTPEAPRSHAAALALDAVTLRPSGDGERIEVATVALTAGVATSVIGPDGSGAAALVELLLGHAAPDGGVVLLDGAPLLAAQVEGWRARSARVPGRTLMIRGTLAANLRLAAPEATAESMWAALTAVGLYERVHALGRGLALEIGPAGHRFTAGEARKLSLARALLRSPRLLVLEEPVEPLASEDEDDIDRVAAGLRDRCTIILRARSSWMLGRAQDALIMDGGRIAEFGPVDQLLRDPASRLSRLWAQD